MPLKEPGDGDQRCELRPGCQIMQATCPRAARLRRGLRTLAVLMVLIATVPAAAERSTAPVRKVPPAELLAELGKGGCILHFRHAATEPGRAGTGWERNDEACATQRNLSDQGRDDARRIGAAIRALGIPIGRVLASPLCRAVETAQLIFGRGEKVPDVRGDPAATDNSDRYAGLRNLLATAKVERGANLAIVGHGMQFESVAGPPELDLGEVAVVRPLGNRFEVYARLRVEDWATLRAAGKR